MQLLAQPWINFLNRFVDELHKHNMNCCGYTNPYDNGTRGCKKMEATHDYQGAQCADCTNSSVERFISHATSVLYHLINGVWIRRSGCLTPGRRPRIQSLLERHETFMDRRERQESS